MWPWCPKDADVIVLRTYDVCMNVTTRLPWLLSYPKLGVYLWMSWFQQLIQFTNVVFGNHTVGVSLWQRSSRSINEDYLTNDAQPSMNCKGLSSQHFYMSYSIDIKRGASVPSLLVFTVTAPIEASLDAKFCTEKCPDAGRNIEANFRGGLPAVTGTLTLNIGSYNKNCEVFRKSVYEHVARYWTVANNLIYQFSLIPLYYSHVNY